MELVLQMQPLLYLVVFTSPLVLSARNTMEVAYKWTTVDFKFTSEAERDRYLNTSQFIPANCVLNDVDVWKGTVFKQALRFVALYVTVNFYVTNK